MCLEAIYERSVVAEYLYPVCAIFFYECNYYLPITDGNGNKLNEIRVDCDVIPTIKGDYRYLYKINGKKIARKNLIQQLINLSLK